ncbi:MAG: ZIP family metal transporter [Clostridia bacterium]|nr:ZIP family metal transporter [Oscillospiraceae bacterium]MBR4979691.1 ZIP family metal transporter [Clostridia bacterium]
MSDELRIAAGIMIPFFGTLLGAAAVFFIKNNNMGDKLRKLLLGFASGVMIAASVWSLLIPSISMSAGYGSNAWIPATAGFLLGMGFLLLLDTVTPHIHINDSEHQEGKPSGLGKSMMLILAVTLHNIPEGMAVGVAFAGVISGKADITMSGAIALAIGIAIQNFPEGAIISAPLLSSGLSKKKSFLYGAASGIVEPIGAVLTLLITSAVTSALPYILSFAAGAMIYVVVEELIPESRSENHSNAGNIGVAFGFALMMALDVALG